jgi:hypothetical protein
MRVLKPLFAPNGGHLIAANAEVYLTVKYLNRAAMLSLKHFNFARRIRCDQAPSEVF